MASLAVQPGHIIGGRYQLRMMIGVGGMGTVWGANDRHTGGEVAVKFLHLNLVNDAQLVQRFMQEGEVGQQLKHRFIIRTFDAGRHEPDVGRDALPYLVTELLDGESLAEVLRRTHRIPCGLALALGSQVAEATEVAHLGGVLHRDIKPANVFLHRDPDGDVVPKVLDFGISKLLDPQLDAGLTATGLIVGSPMYVSPEQALGRRDVDARSDVWSIGVMLHRMLTGEPPFASSGTAVMAEIVGTDVKLDRLREFPAPVMTIVWRCLRRDRSERFASAGDLASALEEAVRSLELPTDLRPLLPDLAPASMAAPTQRMELPPEHELSEAESPDSYPPQAVRPRMLQSAAARDVVADDPPRAAPKVAVVAPREVPADDDGGRALAEQRLGTTIAGCYTLNRLIGLGGSGAVYSALAMNGKQVALKILHPALSRMTDIRERFHREALIARRIYHPGVARVLDDGTSPEGDVYIAMELLEGESIEARASRVGGALPLNEVIAISAAALEILDAAHGVGVVHRDLKPDNLFLTTERSLKILDFGIARLDTNERFVKRTHNGVIMGTPAFMAPEQARASWGQVDKRTDVWAVGAIMFTLLAGRPVHSGGSVGEVIAAASMRPAPSLGRVARVPIEIVRVVDRALAFDQHERFAGAGEMRAALLAAIEELRNPQAAKPGLGSTSAGPQELEALDEGESAAEKEGKPFAVIEATDAARRSLRELWKTLELALLAMTQYGMRHPETDKRLAQAVAFGVAEVARTQEPLQWNVTPYSFTAGGAPVWEPDTPYDRVPYQLFVDGIRVVTLLPGVANEELDTFVRLLVRDRARELAPDDDFVTLLWEADFTHVTYQAIDSFGTGDLTRRSVFENDVRGIQALGRGLPQGKIATNFARRVEGRSAAASSASIFKLLDKEGVDAASIVSAETMLAGRAPGLRPTLDLPPEMKRVLSARLSGDAAVIEPKFARSVALAWAEARASGAVEPLVQKLRAAIDGTALGRPEAALRMATTMCSTAGNSQNELLGAVISATALKKILAVAKAQPPQVDPGALKAVVLALDGTAFDVVLEAVLGGAEDALRDLLVASFLTRGGIGNEARLGALFKAASEETGLAVARILVRSDTKEAKSALALAAASPSGIVRIEALGHLEGANSDRIRVELKALLEDADSALRMAALRTMEASAVRLAGPSLVLRIRSGKFDALPLDERRQALKTLAALAPRRAEEVAVEVLLNAGLLPSEAREQSRVLAVELLGQIAQSDAAKEAIAVAETARWRSSAPLRQAAEAARKRLAKMPPSPWTVPPPAPSLPPPPPAGPKTLAPPRPGAVSSVGPDKVRK